MFLSFLGYSHHPDQHSFPTRRSSDLPQYPQQKIGLCFLPSPIRLHQVYIVEALFLLSQHISALNQLDRKSTRLNSSHVAISYAVFCLKKKNISVWKKMLKQRN